MASSDAILTRPGQVNLAGDPEALFLKLFAGEVLTEFEKTTIFKDKHYSRTIKNGKSASFPLIGRTSVQTHTPGTYIQEGSIGAAEKVIAIDAKVVAPLSIADIDEAKNHYDVRGPYSTEIGRALAYNYDKNVARSMILSARSSSPLTGRAGGTVLTNAAYATDGDVLGSAIFKAAQTLDEKDVAPDDRNAFFRPAQFYLLAQNTKLLNKDWGGDGEFSKGRLGTVANVTIFKTNQLPGSNDTAVATIPTQLRLDYSTTIGVISTPMSAASVSLMAVAMEMEREVRTQSYLMIGSYACGHDFLRPDCALELNTA